MVSLQQLEMDSEKQGRFWSTAAVPHYKGSVVCRALFAVAKPYLGQRILDAGAADGSLLRYIRAQLPEADVVGVDLAPKSPEVQKANCTALPFAAGSFDSVIFDRCD